MTRIHTKTLKIHTLASGWSDKDEVLLHAAFQLLVDFIEKEHVHSIDWSADARHKRAWGEMKSLYAWWKKKRPARHSPLDNRKLKRPPMKFKKIPNSDLSQMVEPDRKKYAAYYTALKKDGQLQKKWLDEDQRNLHRLIEIRQFMWT